MSDVNKFNDKNSLLNIDKDNSGVRIGQRIKTIREAREMTRAELGALVGLDQNRVQQYENGRRKPKLPLLRKIANALGVNILALMDPTLDSYVGVMYALFQMEEHYGMKIVKRDGCYCLQFGDGKTGGMNTNLKEWYKVRQTLVEALPVLTDEERKKKTLEYNLSTWAWDDKTGKNIEEYYI